MIRKTAGVILAGGRSSRMGREKPLLDVGGRPIIERVVAAVGPCVGETVVVTNRPDLYGFLGLRLLEDIQHGRGPLAGMLTALRGVSCDAALVVAGDYPFLDAVTLARIVREDPGEGVVVPEIDGQLQPLCALYAAATAKTIEKSLADGELMVHSLIARLPRRVLTQEEFGGPAASRTFLNINTPDDLKLAEKLLGETDARR